MKGMDTISTLKREGIEQLSGGRIATMVEIDGEPIRLITSARRTKTTSVKFSEGMFHLSVPALMPDADIVRTARGLIAKVKTKQRNAKRARSNPALFERALHLARVWLNAEVMPTSVVWSDRQNTRWGSCSVHTGAIRISSKLQEMPQWVIDGVLVHELAHLKYPDHSQAFRDFTRHYPRMDEADAFLHGVSFAQHYSEDKTFPEAYD